ncbi:hypothetical protein HJC23_013786 [Cyclotella cryptica]|uniref:UBA domain-containing protein n=1 Tax=Cyclotella cryptica TaxID=29204 RepID=A0ABD3PFH5_9STRA|eukprot:CCRYP_014964-RA/>CCRYP_014964-RA protein AED:0.37 eAED:0.36 QI:0/-1/0/1/-1/1/1/0/732
MNSKELILSHLRQQKIKLWLPPYYTYSHQQTHDSSRPETNCHGALRELASSLIPRVRSDNDVDVDNDETAHNLNVDTIYNVLIELQSPAVKKYVEKHSVDFKIVMNSPTDISVLPSEITDRWGSDVSMQKKKSNAFIIGVVGISPSLTVGMVSEDLSRMFHSSVMRFIYRGKNLSAFDDCIGKVVTKDGAIGNKEILCIVSPTAARAKSRTWIPAVSTTETTTTSTEVTQQTVGSPIRTDETIISSIRQAAHTLQNSSSSQFEITDQSGHLVSMSQNDSTAFLTALGLHRLGRSKMDVERHDRSPGAKKAPCSPQDGIASALTFLLEADAEWKSTAALTSWMDRVDNYGLLQLDISWCYLLLRSLDNLPDAIARLNRAEAVLRKQVHSNFVTLALAQAEMGNHIPPLCSIFVRLFLLQGVAYRTMRNDAEATKRLDWARLLCQRLRTSSPSDTVDELCNVYSMTDRSVVVAALRQKDGNPDEAGDLIAAGREEERLAARKRRRQRKVGKCSNGSDWVNLDLVSTLAGILGLSVDNDDQDQSSDSEGDADGRDPESMSISIVTGLLRLTNNNIEESLQMYNQIGAEKVLQRIDELDKVCGRRKRSRDHRKNDSTKHRVHDVDVAILVSMGVEDSKAREALRATGNVDTALVWLSTVNDEGDDIPAAANDEDGMGEDPRRRNSSGEGEALDAQQLLRNELGNALDNSKSLEKEWLGIDLNDEWDLIEKYSCSDT